MDVSVSFTLRRLYPTHKSGHGTDCVGGWVGSKTGLDDVDKRKVDFLRRESNPA
jgi:hypothetical protein